MTNQEAVTAIHKIKKSFKTSQLKIIHIFHSRKVTCWYTIIDFEVNGKKYEYRADAREAWIEAVA